MCSSTLTPSYDNQKKNAVDIAQGFLSCKIVPSLSRVHPLLFREPQPQAPAGSGGAGERYAADTGPPDSYTCAQCQYNSTPSYGILREIQVIVLYLEKLSQLLPLALACPCLSPSLVPPTK